MQLCVNCAAELIPGAKYCHRCGDNIVERTKACPSCSGQSPLASVFCHHCGFHFEGRRKETRGYQPRHPLDFDAETMTAQVKALFFKSLRQRVEEEHDPARYSDYVERFYQSRFGEIYEVRAEQIAEDTLIQWERFGAEALPDIDRRIDESFEGLLDYFTIQFCPDLNGILLPGAILKYERAQPGRTDVWAMTRDFLDFEREQEVVYTDFISMPEDALKNACKNFLAADRKEKVWFICDLSLKGGCREGFSMTDQAIYWRAPLNKARKVSYRELHDIKREKEWITINGHFFTANPSLNLKIYKLLKKIKSWRPVVTAREKV
jgi:Double zinc ribbon